MLSSNVHPRLTRIMHCAGSLLSIAAIVFVTFKLYRQSDQLGLVWLSSRMQWQLAGSVLLYALALGLLAHTWYQRLQHDGVAIPVSLAWRLYADSQLGKYLPGNVFQFVLRQLQGVKAGIPQALLIRSSVLEITGLVITAVLLSIGLWPPLIQALWHPWVDAQGWHFSVTLFLTAGVLALAGLSALLWQLRRHWFCGFRPLRNYVLFHCIAATIFVSLLLAQGLNLSMTACIVTASAYVLAWLCGFVTPGAPGGIGIRELVLLVLLQHLIHEPDLLQGLLYSRLVNILGDVLFFIGMRLWPRTV